MKDFLHAIAILIDPVGLWRDDLPVKNWMIMPPAELRAALFADPGGLQAQKFFSLPDEPAMRIEVQAARIWSQACIGKFVWPVADKGLKKRLHRIAMPTLIVWGEADGIIAPAYAGEFAARIADARVATVEKSGHLPHLEQPERVARAIREFLA